VNDDFASALRAHLQARARAGVRWLYPDARSLDAFLPSRHRSVPEPVAVRERESLEQIRADLGDCTRCKLHAGRTHLVFGVGNARARLMFVGEGPGQDEDEQGEPFVGKAGQLLNRIIQAIGLEREDVYIANVVKSRPPGNRNPEPDEIATCLPFLERQIESVRPAVLVTLGNVPTKALLGTETGIMKLRGSWRQWRGIPLMPTFHPAYLLRNPEDKRLVWEDMLQVAERYNRELPAGEKACRPKTRAAEASEG
jgi:uracil-DNA glycosylase family 4